jgi:hypothetical protein
MVHGYAGERTLLDKWEATYGVPVVSTGVTQVRAMRAWARERSWASPGLSGSINDVFSRYFTDAGFEVLAMEGWTVPFDRVRCSRSTRYIPRQADVHRYRDADLVYLMGGGWRTLDIIETLEDRSWRSGAAHRAGQGLVDAERAFLVGRAQSGIWAATRRVAGRSWLTRPREPSEVGGSAPAGATSSACRRSTSAYSPPSALASGATLRPR